MMIVCLSKYVLLIVALWKCPAGEQTYVVSNDYDLGKALLGLVNLPLLVLCKFKFRSKVLLRIDMCPASCSLQQPRKDRTSA